MQIYIFANLFIIFLNNRQLAEFSLICFYSKAGVTEDGYKNIVQVLRTELI